MYRRTEAEVRILILAPPQDSQRIADILLTDGLVSAICRSPDSLLSMLTEGAAAAIVAEESLTSAEMQRLSTWVDSQPPWSDLPFVVLSAGHTRARDVEELANVILLDQPRADTILCSLRAAFRGRLRQYEMRHRQQALTQVNADLEQFAHSASHDLREPIRNIAVYTDLLSNRYGDVFDQQAQQFVEYVRSGAARMETLVAGLLAYAEASAIVDALHDAVDATQPLEVALSNLQEVVEESGAHVTYDALQPVRMREVHLRQLFENLISNAIKYRGRRAPEVEITARIENGSCVYSIQDNGIGIPPEYHGQIFEIFKRLHTNTRYPGTGMGLAICRRIVERYRGNIWVESEVGKGSNFSFKIPA